MKKYFLFADPHGDYSALKNGLDKAGFSEFNPNHFIISLGDLFDRGSYSKDIFYFLLDMEQKGKAYFILGNHDEFLLDFLLGKDSGIFNCQYNGLWDTIISFTEIPLTTPVPADYEITKVLQEKRKEILINHPALLPFLGRMKHGFIIEDNIITHAGFSADYTAEGIRDYRLNNFAKTGLFVRILLNGDTELPFKFIFGHWGAYLLNKDFFGDYKPGRAFKHKNVIGLDATTMISGMIFVHIIDSEEEPIQIPEALKLKHLENYAEFAREEVQKE